MPFVLEKEIRFEAAHHLPAHDGKCRRPHGHGYRCVLVLESAHLIAHGPKTGMVRDYADIAAAAEPLLRDYLDHHDLNETLAELEGHTTSENVARWIYHRLKPALPELVAVRLHETCQTSTEYRP